MADIRVICAIGKSGQLGLKGHMPWEGNRDRAYIEDVERFFEITRGHVRGMVVGRRFLTTGRERTRGEAHRENGSIRTHVGVARVGVDGRGHRIWRPGARGKVTDGTRNSNQSADCRAGSSAPGSDGTPSRGA